MTIDDFALAIGQVIMAFGGMLLGTALILFLMWIVGFAWIAFSKQFRAICKAESLIHEYRKDREEFLKWKEGKGNG